MCVPKLVKIQFWSYKFKKIVIWFLKFEKENNFVLIQVHFDFAPLNVSLVQSWPLKYVINSTWLLKYEGSHHFFNKLNRKIDGDIKLYHIWNAKTNIDLHQHSRTKVSKSKSNYYPCTKIKLFLQFVTLNTWIVMCTRKVTRTSHN